MSEFEFTPGPWELDGSWIESESKYIAEVKNFRDECEIFKPLHPESAANANLIAAAPELLEALQEFVDLFPDVIDGDAIMPALDKGMAALAKELGQ